MRYDGGMNNLPALLDPLLRATPQQHAALQDHHRFVVVAAGRRWGKTTLGALGLLQAAETRPGIYLYVAPSRAMLQLCWESFMAVVSTAHQPNKATLRIRLWNNSEICFLTEDSVLGGSTKGFRAEGIFIDEFFYCRQKASLAAVLLPAVSDSGGWVMVAGTPPPRRAVSRLRLLLRLAVMRAGFDLSSVGIHAYSTYGSGLVPLGEIERARWMMSKIAFESEYLPQYEQ